MIQYLCKLLYGEVNMEFGEKIQKLRKQNKLLQEQLAEKLYVSRAAISKWESGKGYPNIDSLKDIAKLFDKTIDELLSSEEIIVLAKKENVSNIKEVNNLIFGLLDVVSILFIFLPIYAKMSNNFIYSVPLISADMSNIIKLFCIVILFLLSLIGIVEIIFNFIDNRRLQRIVNITSFVVGIFSVLCFLITRQIYLTVIIFIILIIKLILVGRNIVKN